MARLGAGIIDAGIALLRRLVTAVLVLTLPLLAKPVFQKNHPRLLRCKA